MCDKKVVITIHGFKTGQYHDFDTFQEYVATKSELGVVKVDLYNTITRENYNYKIWGDLAKKVVDSYINQGYKVHLIGYSMSAGIAAYVARYCPISKLILIAPSFHIFGGQSLPQHLKIFYRMIKLRFKYRKRLERYQKMEKKLISKLLIYNIFKSIQYYRKNLKYIKSETLIIYGTKDTYIPKKSISYAFKKIKVNKKQLWLIDELDHLFIFNLEKAKDSFDRIIEFLEK